MAKHELKKMRYLRYSRYFGFANGGVAQICERITKQAEP